MPRVSASNGIRPEIRALSVIAMGVPVTPGEIDAYVGTGAYASKYVSFLQTRYGFIFSVQKDGRKVVSYTLIKEPANIAALRSAAPATIKSKSEPKPKAKQKPSKPVSIQAAAAAKVKVTKTKVKSKPKVKTVSKPKAKVAKPVDEVEKTFGSSGALGAIESDWDSLDSVDIKNLL